MSRMILIVAFLILQLLLQVAMVTIMPKEVNYCGTQISSAKLFDGNTKMSDYEAFTEKCETSTLAIKFDGPYTVHYVIVYEGEGNNEGQLDFFTVERIAETLKIPCGTYQGTSRKDGKGMRINCQPSTKLFLGIQIISRKNEGFNMSEIEVHALNKVIPGKRFMAYRGCFKKFSDSEIYLETDTCEDYCLKKSKIFAGIKLNRTCSCEDDLDSAIEIAVSDCDSKCTEGYSICGKTDSYAVYMINSPLPYQIGCIKDAKGYITKLITLSDMTVDKCLKNCNDFKYAFLQNGDSCSCDVALNALGSSDFKVEASRCSVKCSGDALTFCGGVEGLASVYSTCKTRPESKWTCTQFLNCNDSYDMFGDCSGDCQPGYAGDQCLEREMPSREASDGWLKLLLMLLPYILLGLLAFIVLVSMILCMRSSNVSGSSAQGSVKQVQEEEVDDN